MSIRGDRILDPFCFCTLCCYNIRQPAAPSTCSWNFQPTLLFVLFTMVFCGTEKALTNVEIRPSRNSTQTGMLFMIFVGIALLATVRPTLLFRSILPLNINPALVGLRLSGRIERKKAYPIFKSMTRTIRGNGAVSGPSLYCMI